MTGRQNHQDSKAKPLVPVFPSTTMLFCLLPELWRDDHLSCAPTAPSPFTSGVNRSPGSPHPEKPSHLGLVQQACQPVWVLAGLA